MAPRKGRRQKSVSSSRFLFVNEDASTVTRVGKDHELDRDKQSHVQRQNFARRKLARDGLQSTLQHHAGDGLPDLDGSIEFFDGAFVERFPSLAVAQPARSLPESALAPPSWQPEGSGYGQPTPSAAGLSFHFADSTGAATGYQNGVSAPNPTVIQSSYTTEPFQQHQYHKQQHLIHASTNQSLYNPLRGTISHPLLSGTLADDTTGSSSTNSINHPFTILSQWAPILMQYWTTVIIRESFYIDTRLLPLSRLRHAPAIHAEMQDAMSHPSHLYSLLAAAAMQMLSREGRLLSPSPTNHASGEEAATQTRLLLFLKTRALSSLRAHLASSAPLAHNTVADVLRLLTVAFFSDAYDTAVPHHEAMQAMIASLGGLGTFSDYFVETRVTLHWAANLKRLTRPVWGVVQWADPGEGDGEVRLVLGLLRLYADGGDVGVNGNSGFDGDSDGNDEIRKTARSSRGMARGFAALVAARVLAPVLKQAVDDLADVLRFERYIQANAAKTIREGGIKSEHFRWANSRHIALGLRLLSVDSESDFRGGDEGGDRGDVARGGSGQEMGYEYQGGGQEQRHDAGDDDYYLRNEAIRIALIFTVGLTRSPGRGMRCGSKSVWRLREVLELSVQPRASQWQHHHHHHQRRQRQPSGEFTDWWDAPPASTTDSLSAPCYVTGSRAPSSSSGSLPLDPLLLAPPSSPSSPLHPPTQSSPHSLLLAKWLPYFPALLWISCVGAMTARTGTADWEWFISVARDCVAKLRLGSWDGLESVLGGFIYEPAVLREALWVVWRRIGDVKLV